MIEAMNWSGVRLYDWSLMSNHFHFLLETTNLANLGTFMTTDKLSTIGQDFVSCHERPQNFVPKISLSAKNGDPKFMEMRDKVGQNLPPGVQAKVKEEASRWTSKPEHREP